MKKILVLKQYFWLINLFILSWFVLLSSDLFLSALREHLKVPPRQPTLDKNVKSTHSGKKTLPFYSIITKRNIFNSAPLKENAVQGNAEDKIEDISSLLAKFTPKTELRLRLLGTIVWDAEKSRAIIENLNDKKQDMYKKGDVIEGAEIIDIMRNKVLLLNGDTVETLLAFDTSKKEEQSSSFSSRSHTRGKSSIRNISRNKYIIPKQEIDNALKDMNSLLTQARMRPHFENGKPAGYRVDSIKKNSLVNKIGLRNGDILQSINGLSVGSPKEAFEIYNQLRNESQIKLNIKRNNRVENFTYTIKP